VALGNLSFAVGQGELLCLSGPSGCGKTTTLRLIAGLERPDRGAVLIGAEPTADEGKPNMPEAGGVGMVFQDLALWPHMRVERHLDFVLRGRKLSRASRRERVHAVLDTCRLLDRRRAHPSELSGGQQQRLAIARALATNPGLLLLDEPFANLDADLRDHFTEEFRKRNREGTTIILASHDQEDAEAMGGPVLALFSENSNRQGRQGPGMVQSPGGTAGSQTVSGGRPR